MAQRKYEAKRGVRVADDRWKTYVKAILDGHSQAQAGKMAQVSPSTVHRQSADPASRLNKVRGELGVSGAGTFALEDVKGEASRALEDFGLFRRRYFARSTSPWQEEAAYKILDLAATDHKEYVVVNVAPGVGKSTFFAHDLPIWLAVKDRTRRTMIGSRTANQANKYTGRIRRSFERTTLMKADAELFARGLAKDATGNLVADYGRFKPSNNDRWRVDEFFLEQAAGVELEDKEPNFSSYGMDSGVLGNRFNFVIWDDLVDRTNTRTSDGRQNLVELWESAMENRLEPKGLLILQGQRIASNDLYRYALDQVEFSEEFEEKPEMAPKIYQHIVYKAHYEEKCGKDALGPTHKGNYPKGCLLDDYRLPWRELGRLKKNRENRFELTYQQQDVDSADALIKEVWIEGGRDKQGRTYRGCWDMERNIGTWPQNLDAYSVVTVDPSPTKYWAIQWFGYNAETKEQHLIDLHRGQMDAPQFLDWDAYAKCFTGLLEEWWQRSNDQGHPFKTLIFEANAAQRWLHQYDHFKRWTSLRGVTLVSHQTNRNKSSEDYGVQMLAPEYEHGRVRLPGGERMGSRDILKPMIKELMEWTPEGGGATDDCVMAHWFLLWNAPNLFDYNNAKPPQFKRPSWLDGKGFRK